jgi:hypothetical protein
VAYFGDLEGGVMAVLAAVLTFLNTYHEAITAVATAFIAVYTFLLWRSTSRLWEETKKTANAAKQSSDSWMEAEGPWISITDLSHLTEITAVLSGLPRVPSVDFKWTNYGRTPALITGFKNRLTIIRSATELLDEPDYGEITEYSIEVPILPKNGRSQQVVLDETITWDLSMASEIQRNVATLVLFGLVKYRDIFQRESEFRYCFKYGRQLQGFGWEIVERRSYNQRIKRPKN